MEHLAHSIVTACASAAKDRRLENIASSPGTDPAAGHLLRAIHSPT
jgi:hypothetical protein